MTNYTRYKDIPKAYVRLEGEKRSMFDVVGQEILIHNFTIGKSKFPPENNDKCTKIQWSTVEEPDKKFIVFTGS